MKLLQKILYTLLITSSLSMIHPNQPITITATGTYDPMMKMARLDGQTYIGVIEYSKATTPPNIAHKQLVAFASIPTPGYKKTDKPLLGGKRPSTTLYGIPVQGQAIKVVNQNGESIGGYWSDSKAAQLENGMTYTNIVEYTQAVTPPNIANPKLVTFGSIANPNFTGEILMGGQKQNITLYGEPLQQKARSVIRMKNTQANPILKNAAPPAQSITIKGNNGEKGQYNPQAKSAWLQTKNGKQHYNQIVEYRQAVTPPNISNQKLVPFATMQNPQYKKQPKGWVGGQMKNIVLYGMPLRK